MRIISLWQPYASLLVHGHKFNETRSWPAPPSLIGQTIGIAATKQIKHEQRLAVADPVFAEFYETTGLPKLEELPMGGILGTVFLHSSDLITDEDHEDVMPMEIVFGDWTPGRFAWRMRYPRLLHKPIFTRGSQGIWEFDIHEEAFHADPQVDQDRPPDIRSQLRIA